MWAAAISLETVMMARAELSVGAMFAHETFMTAGAEVLWPSAVGFKSAAMGTKTLGATPLSVKSFMISWTKVLRLETIGLESFMMAAAEALGSFTIFTEAFMTLWAEMRRTFLVVSETIMTAASKILGFRAIFVHALHALMLSRAEWPWSFFVVAGAFPSAGAEMWRAVRRNFRRIAIGVCALRAVITVV